MTKLELINANKALYAEYSEQIKSMQGLEKLVAENLILKWIKGKNWVGGLSDGASIPIYNKLMKMGYSFDELYDEFNRQAGKLIF